MRFKDEVPRIDTYKTIRGSVEAKKISGSINFDNGFGIFLVVNWNADLTPPTGRFELYYTYKLPGKEQKNFVNSIPLKSRSTTRCGGGGVRIAKWDFCCPSQTNRRCKKWCQNLYLGIDGQFCCMNCAKVFRRNAVRNRTLDGLFKKPLEMMKLLSSKTIPIKKKLQILEIADRALKDYKRRMNKLRLLQRKLSNLKANSSPSSVSDNHEA